LSITAGPNTLAPIVANMTWTGGGGNDNWSTAGNWGGTNMNPGDTLFFDGSTRLVNNNDTTAGTLYSNITFQSTAGAFVLGGNAVTLATGSGKVVNNSANIQTVNVGLNYNGNIALTGGSSGSTALIIGNGITNTAATGLATITLGGTGTLTNLFASTSNGTNSIATAASTANWTIVDNSSSSEIVVSNWGFNILGGGTLNFGNSGSAPVLTTLIGGQGTDSTIGDTGTAATLNVVNGILTMGRRFNSQNASINVSGGALNVWNQIQIANSAVGNIGNVTVSGGTLNAASSGGTTAGGTFFLASRGTGTLTISGSGLVECSILDVSRNAAGTTGGSVGTVNLNGGTLRIDGKISTATQNAQTAIPGTATFNFNGGILKANNTNTSGVTFQGSTVAPIIPITAVVKSGGAVIETASGQDMTILEPLQHDSGLGGTPDGGLTKNGVGVLALNAVNTFTGPTIISAGTLALTNSSSIANSSTITIAGGATFDVSGLSSAFALGSSQTLSNSSSTATLIGNIADSTGTNSLTYASGTPSFIVTNGTLTLSASTVVNVNNTGAALTAASYKIISAANTGTIGTVAGTVPSSVTVSGGGLGAGLSASLQIIGGELFLVVAPANTAPVVGNVVTNFVTTGLTYKIAISSLSNSAAWSDADNDAIALSSVNNSALGKSVTKDSTFIYYNAPVTNEDSFTYTISDGTLTANGTVYLEATNSNAQTYNITGSVVNGDNSVTLSGFSIPGRTNVIERTGDLIPPISWTPIGTNVVDGTGHWQFTDPPTPPNPSYYRSVTQP